MYLTYIKIKFFFDIIKNFITFYWLSFTQNKQCYDKKNTQIFGAPGRIRTCNISVMSRWFYH